MPIYLKQYLEKFPGQPFFYGNAAHAFYDVMIWLQKNRPRKHPNIIMPVYIPAKIYRFILAAGYIPKFYDVSAELDYDPDEIRRLIDNQTQAVFAVHFFGVPVDMRPLKKITEQAGVFLIEDCAHTLNSRYKGVKAGTTGDCALFSTRKMLQLHCSGLMVFNNHPWDFTPSGRKRVRSVYTAWHLMGSRIKFALNRWFNGQLLFQDRSVPVTGYINFAENQIVDVKKMDHLTRWFIHSIDLEKMIRIRRNNAEYLLNRIEDTDFFRPAGKDRYIERDDNGRLRLKTGQVPFSLPVLIPEGYRDQIQKALCEASVVCFAGWPEAPFGLKGFPGADRLQGSLLELPVHHLLNRYQLDRIIAVMTAFRKQVNRGKASDPANVARSSNMGKKLIFES